MNQVQQGAQFLDTAVPDWFHPSCATPIYLPHLNMDNFSHCIIGHLCSFTAHPRQPVSHRSWLRRAADRFHLPYFDVDDAWTAAHGFYPAGSPGLDNPYDWGHIAQSFWVAEITARRTQVAANAAIPTP